MSEQIQCKLAIGVLIDGEKYFFAELNDVNLQLLKSVTSGNKPVVPVGEVSVSLTIGSEVHQLIGKVLPPASKFASTSCPYPPPICPPLFNQNQYHAELETQSEYVVAKTT